MTLLVTLADQPPQDPTQRIAPEAPAPTGHQPGGSIQLASAGPLAPPVTRATKVAAVILLLTGLVGLWVFSTVPLAFLFARTARQLVEVVVVEIVVVVLTCLAFLGGIDILRGKDRGRIIGIGFSLMLGAASLVTELKSPDGLAYWLPFGLYAYSLFVLVARWRGFPRAPSSGYLGPVTRVSKSAGIVLLALGLGLVAYGGAFAASDHPGLAAASRGVSLVIGMLIIVSGFPEVLVGIAILRGKEWGRSVGIVLSVIFGVWTFLVAIGYTEVGINGIGDPGEPIYAPAFAAYAYSLFVLLARWRGPARV
jgi:hypothetical protein